MTDKVGVYAATIDHKHGTDLYLDRTEEGLKSQVAGYVADWWEDAFPHEALPDDEEEAIRRYFEKMGEGLTPESLTYFDREEI